jgi:predicted PurR-regulated permease PerM
MTVASFVIIVAGMRAATAILVPFLLSLFVAIVCTPLLFWMRRKGVPNALAVVAILVGIMTVGLLLSSFLRTSLNDFTSALPGYQASLSLKATAFLAWLKDLGLEVPDQILISDLNPSKAMTVAAGALASLSSILTNVFLILLTVVFILLEASGVPQKVQAAFGNPERPMAWMHEFTKSLNRYLAIKTLFSLLTGLAVWVWLVVLGVDYPFLWGLLAFMLNYVPSIGSIIAALPAVLLTLIQLGSSHALLACLGYLVINVTIGSVLEPKFMGRGLGLSTLVVFLSLVFWGWILGPVGMVLSVPLTMIMKIALDSTEDTRWIAVMLGPAPSGSVIPSSEKWENNENER